MAVWLLATAVTKILRPQATVQLVRDVFPGALVRPILPAAVGTELALSGVLLVPGFRRTAGILTSLFIMGATLVVALRVTRRANFMCACWGGERSTNGRFRNPQNLDVKWKGLVLNIARPIIFSVRNGSFLFLACWIWLYPARGWDYGVLTAATVIVPIAIGFGLLVDVFRRRRELRLREHPLRAAFLPYARSLVAMSWYQRSGNASDGLWMVHHHGN